MDTFSESQKFNQPWLIGLLILVILASAVPAYIAYEDFKNEWKLQLSLAFAIVLPLFLSVLFLFFLKLKTKIDLGGIHYGFYPFRRNLKTIPWREIKSCEVIQYSPLMDYGGWGYRFGRKGKALNVRGNKGIFIVFKNDKKLLIGTQKETEAKRIIKLYFKE